MQIIEPFWLYFRGIDHLPYDFPEKVAKIPATFLKNED
jgi:hypothetical protein